MIYGVRIVDEPCRHQQDDGQMGYEVLELELIDKNMRPYCIRLRMSERDYNMLKQAGYGVPFEVLNEIKAVLDKDMK